MDKIYIVMTETNEDGDSSFDVLNGKYFTDKETARKEMLKDFNNTKSDFDECDDIDENHEADECCLSANMEWSERWLIVELEK